MVHQLRPVLFHPSAEDYLTAAKATAQWIRNSTVKTPEGNYWPEQPHPTATEVISFNKFSLYSGSAGIIFFFLQLYRVTKEDSYLNDALEGGNYILHHWSINPEETYGGIPNSHFGVPNGAAGIAFVLTALWQETKLDQYGEFARDIIHQISKYPLTSPNGHQWSGENGVNLDSGIILFLIYASQLYQEETWLETAKLVGKKILSKGNEEKNGGKSWPSINPGHFGLLGGSSMPNYAYGTAGIAYTFSKLYEATNDTVFLEAATDGAAYIKSIAKVEEDNALIPYMLPHLTHIHYIGLCNGPVGTSRLFYNLYKITGNEEYKKFLQQLINGIYNSGAPEFHSVGYWNVTCLCCGSAGLSNLFLGLWSDTKDSSYLKYAGRVGKQLLSESFYDDENGACWYQAWNRLQPWKVTAKTGYFDGAAGNATELLNLYLAKTGQFDILRLPDDPFPKQVTSE